MTFNTAAMCRFTIPEQSVHTTSFTLSIITSNANANAHRPTLRLDLTVTSGATRG